MWQRRFGLDPNIIGKKLTLDGKSCDIIGVMPAGFKALLDSDENPREVWRPYPFGNEPMNERGIAMLRTLARLKPGISVERAQAEMNTLLRTMGQT